MSPVLTALIALQQVDTAAEQARRRLADMPLAEQAADAAVAMADEAVMKARARLAENNVSRRELEKQVAEIDTRLSRFEDHKAAVKTNQEFTALLHEIATAKTSKDALEEQILLLLDAADGVTADIKTAEQQLAVATNEQKQLGAALSAERRELEDELRRLGEQREGQTAHVQKTVLAKYEQILKQRRMLAVAAIEGDICSACHVRLRPAMAQQIRRNEEIVQCDSCQRILYAIPRPAPEETQ
jgi:predicted  nucleic acid-binding Zn-ribbon protein